MIIYSFQNVICYFANWAEQRNGDGKFVPENLDATLCSHVFYAFASLDTSTLEISPSAPRMDIDNKFYERVQEVARGQNRDVKVFIAMGGWTDSSGDAYSR